MRPAYLVAALILLAPVSTWGQTSRPTVSIEAVHTTRVEGQAVQFRVSSQAETFGTRNAGDVTVTLSVTQTGSFTSGTPPTSVTLAPNDQETLSISTQDDNLAEADGSVTMTIVAGTGYTIHSTKNEATVEVRDNDSPRTMVNILSQGGSKEEGEAALFQVTSEISTEESLDIRVEVTQQGEFIEGTPPTSVTIQKNSDGLLGGLFPLQGVLMVPTTDDELDEADGSVTVRILENRAYYTIGVNGSATVTISDNDLPTVSLEHANNPRSYVEGGNVTFTLTRDGSLNDYELTIDVEVEEDGKFISGAPPTTVTFAENQSTASLVVPTVDDTDDEPDGSITAKLIEGTGYTINPANTQRRTTVTDNDLPEVSLSEVDPEINRIERLKILEGNPVTFELKRVGDLEVELEIHLNLTQLDGTEETLSKTFAANYDTALVTVETQENDVIEETHRSVTLTITADDAYTIRSGHSTRTVLVPDDDMQVFLRRADINLDSVVEGHSTRYNLELSRNGDVSLPLRVDLSTHSDDRTVRPTGFRTIPAGQTSTEVAVSMLDDDVHEPDGTVTVKVEGLNDRNPDREHDLGDPHSVSFFVRDDDGPPGVTVSPQALTVFEGESNTYTLVLASEPSASVTIDVAVSDGTDVSASPESLTFTTSNWHEAQTVTVSADEDDDAIADASVTLTHTVSGGDYQGVSTGDVTVTITENDEPGVTISPQALTVLEGMSGTYTVALSTQPSASVTIDVEVPSGTDVSVSPASLTFTTSNWREAQTVTVSADEDDDAMADALVTLTHTVSGGDYQGVSADDVTVTIIEDEIPTLTIENRRVGEADGTMVFEVAISMPSSNVVTVDYTTSNGTAIAGEDYTTRTGMLAFPAGTTAAQTFSVQITDDMVVEEEETFTVMLSNVQNAELAGGGTTLSATGTIVDDDLPAITVSAVSSEITEGETAVFELTRSGDMSQALSVTIRVAETERMLSGSEKGTREVEFAAMSATVEISIPTRDDITIEPPSVVSVTILSGNGYRVGTPNSASISVIDNDLRMHYSWTESELTVAEGDGFVTVTVTATTDRNARPSYIQRVALASLSHLSESTAQSGADFRPVSEELGFRSTDFTEISTEEGTRYTATRSFDVEIYDDGHVEETEKFPVHLQPTPGSAPTFGTEVLLITITDDDERGVTVTPTTLSVGEGESGEYTVVLTSHPTETVTISITASGDTDITTQQSSLTFTGSNWSTAQTVTVNATEDGDAVNGTATIMHTVTSSGDYSGETAASVSVTEQDNDSESTEVTLSVFPTSVSESSGQVVTVTGTLNDGTRSEATTVTVSVAGGTASSSDFSSVPNFTLTIAANQPSGNATFTLNPVNDSVDENDEIVSVTGTSSATELTVNGTEVTITDDDTRGVIVTPTTLLIEEGNSGAYTVALSTQPSASVTVDVSVPNGTDVSASPTSLTFTTSNWREAQTVTVSADEDEDAMADAFVILTHAVSGGDYQGVSADDVTVTIIEDEIPTLTIENRRVGEADGTMVFEVAISMPSSNVVTVDYTTSNGTAIAGEDYTTRTGMLTFPAGTTAAQTVSVPIIDDMVLEEEETFTVMLSNVQNAELAGGGTTLSATGTIVDDDLPAITVSSVSTQVFEGENIVFTLARNRDISQALSVTIRVAETERMLSGSEKGTREVEFAAMSATVGVSIPTVDDRQIERSSVVSVTILSGNGYRVGTPNSAAVPVIDNDLFMQYSWTESELTVAEGDGFVTVTVTATTDRNARPPHSFYVALASYSSESTAQSGADYRPVSEFLRFEPTDFTAIGMGDATRYTATRSFDVDIYDDGHVEETEWFSVSLQPVPGTAPTFGTDVVKITITDDDERGVTVTPTTLSVGEGESGEYTVVLTSHPTETVTVSITASGDTDITTQQSSLTFTGSNWSTAQTVTVNAEEDSDAAHGTATISHTVTSSGDYSGETASAVTVTEIDNDTASTEVTLSVTPSSVSESGGGQTVTVTGTLNEGTRLSDTAVTVSVAGGTASSSDFASVSNFTLTIAANQANGNATFTLSPVNDAIDENDEAVSVSGTTSGLTVTATEVTITDDDTRGVMVSKSSLQVEEDGSDTYTVVLTSQPTATVTVSVTGVVTLM